MKLYISALLLSMAQAQNTGLRARWEMANAVINYGSTGIFTLRFETASKDNYDAGLVTTFWDKRCKDTPDGINKQLGAGLVQDPDDPDGSTPKLEMVGAGTESRPELKFKVDTLLMVATTTDDEYSAERPYTQTGNKGVLEFCVRNGLGFTSNPSPKVDNSDTMYTNSYQEVNYIETLVEIEYDLAAGITVSGFQVAPKAKVGTTQTEQYDQALEAYLCTGPQDPEYVKETHANYDVNDGVWIPKPKPQAGNPFNQGSLINICLAIKTEFITKGVRIKTVNSFDFERLVNNPKVTSNSGQTKGEDVTVASSLFQNAISAGSASANYLTSFQPSQCANSIACDFASVLFAEFYATSGEVIGNGKATLRFLSNAKDAPYKMADTIADCDGAFYEKILTEADCEAAKVYFEEVNEQVTMKHTFGMRSPARAYGCFSNDSGPNVLSIMWYAGPSDQQQEVYGPQPSDNVFCKRVDGDAATAAAPTAPAPTAPFKMADNHADCIAEGYYETIVSEADCAAAAEYLKASNNGYFYFFNTLTTTSTPTLYGCRNEYCDGGCDSPTTQIAIAWYTGASTEEKIVSGDQPMNTKVFCKKVYARRLGEGTVESRRLQDGAGQISAVVSIPVNGDVEGPGDLKTAGSATLGATVLASVAAVVGAIVLA